MEISMTPDSPVDLGVWRGSLSSVGRVTLKVVTLIASVPEKQPLESYLLCVPQAAKKRWK